MVFDLGKAVRDNIRDLVPYSSARGEFGGDARVFLDANENSFGSPSLAEDYNRYPDPRQVAIKNKIAGLNGVRASQIFVGNGSDEAIDLLIRIFCRPEIDNIIICPPTYGMYEVGAVINDAGVLRVNLTSEFELDADSVTDAITPNTKLIFLCSPNNPSGNLLSTSSILQIARSFRGIVIVDEAYIQFSNERSLLSEIDEFPNLAVLQTFSKAWGLAGLRVGLAFADEKIVDLLNKVKPPYNVSQVAQDLILTALVRKQEVTETVAEIVRERNTLAERLNRFHFINRVYPSDANFLLVRTANAGEVYRFLLDEKIVVRDRSNMPLCEGCLRITIGTHLENKALLKALEKYEKSLIY